MRRLAREPEKHRKSLFRMLSGPVAFPVGNECKMEESYLGIIAGLIVWPSCVRKGVVQVVVDGLLS